MSGKKHREEEPQQGNKEAVAVEVQPYLEQKLSELEILKQSLDEARAKEKDLYNQILRLGAEFDNFRKRTAAQLSETRRLGREDVLSEVITLADALHQAEQSSEQATDVSALKKGLSLVHKQLEKFIKSQGLVPIKSNGEKLDPHLHEAIARIEKDDVDDGVIVEELQRGYMLEGRVIRPARVRVAFKPKEEAPDKNEEEKHG